MSIKFGTDGWRAIIGKEFTFDNVAKVAQAHSDYLKSINGKTVVIGYDTRFLSEDFANTVAEVFASNGFKVVISKKYCTTPALSLATKLLGADHGIMITASHNTYQYNGYKIKTNLGSPASVSVVNQIQDLIGQSNIKTGNTNFEEADFNQIYIEKLKTYLTKGILRQKQIKIIHDPMFGASMGLLRKLAEDTFLEVEEINNFRDAYFGHQHPEPIDKNLSLLKAKVLAQEAFIGIANDGDGDRVGIVDENGEFLSTQIVFALLLIHTIRNKKYKGAVAKTVSVSYLVDRIAKKEELKIHKTPVGFKYIAEIFENENVAFGGEESGGYGFGFHIPERDGLLSGLMILEMCLLSNKTPSQLVKDLFDEFGEAYYKREDIKVNGDEGRNFVKSLKENPPTEFAGEKVSNIDLTDGVKLIFEDDSWILFRASGTEPVLRIYVETPEKDKTRRFLETAKELIN